MEINDLKVKDLTNLVVKCPNCKKPMEKIITSYTEHSASQQLFCGDCKLDCNIIFTEMKV